MFETITKCKVCGEVVKPGEIKEHKRAHVEKGDVWSKPCKLNGRPCTGVCLRKEHYEACQKPNVAGKVLENNWMCWRDGILFELNDKLLRVKKSS